MFYALTLCALQIRFYNYDYDYLTPDGKLLQAWGDAMQKARSPRRRRLLEMNTSSYIRINRTVYRVNQWRTHWKIRDILEGNGRLTAVAKDGIKKFAHYEYAVTHLPSPLKNSWLCDWGEPERMRRRNNVTMKQEYFIRIFITYSPLEVCFWRAGIAAVSASHWALLSGSYLMLYSNYFN